MDAARQAVITMDGFAMLLDLLAERGYRVVGPTVRDQAIVYDDIAAVSDLPAAGPTSRTAGATGWSARDDDALFGYAVGPHSWKQFLHPPMQRLWRAERTDDDIRVTPEPISEDRFAFIGVRACELHAIAIQDRVFLGGEHVDPHYAARREGAFIVAVNCGEAGGTCFCVSMGTGPKADAGFDLALTETCLTTASTVSSSRRAARPGARSCRPCPAEPATQDEIAAADAVVAAHGRVDGPRRCQPTTSTSSCSQSSTIRAGTTWPSAA